MKLYDVPNYSYIKAKALGDVFFFDHIDGMYSYCKNSAGEVVHLVAWAEVEVVPDPNWPIN